VWFACGPFGFSTRQRCSSAGRAARRGAIVLALFPLIEKVRTATALPTRLCVVLASLLLQERASAGSRSACACRAARDAAAGAARGQGRLTLDADLPLADVFGFFQLPLPESAARAARLDERFARTRHEKATASTGTGAHFRVISLHDGRIARVGLTLAPALASPSAA